MLSIKRIKKIYKFCKKKKTNQKKVLIFRKILDKIKYIFKIFLSKKTMMIYLERNEVKTKIDVAKDDFNKCEVNSSIDSKSFEALSQKSLINCR